MQTVATEVFPEDPLLVVDDEHFTLQSIRLALKTKGVNNIILLQDSTQVLQHVDNEAVSAVLLDIRMPNKNGIEVLTELKANYPSLPVIMLTGESNVDLAVRCMKLGADDFLSKPINQEELISCVRRAVVSESSDSPYAPAPKPIPSVAKSFNPSDYQEFHEILTQDARMLDVFNYVKTIAITDRPVLVSGETGVGKELMARAVHRCSGRQGRYVCVNAAGLDDNVFSDTLFGHKKGSFTGAQETRRGLVEVASDGTLFLDEIGDLSHASQVKLLRLLHEREYYPIGSDMPKIATARFVVATNRNLPEMVKKGDFREDLFYRLRTHRVVIPPLRERPVDLAVLIPHFIHKVCSVLQIPRPQISKEVYTLLEAHDFPGNVRELESIIFDTVTRSNKGELDAQRVKEHLLASQVCPITSENSNGSGALAMTLAFPAKLPTLKDAAEQLVAEAMRRADGNQTRAAKLLGITQQALSKRLKKGG